MAKFNHPQPKKIKVYNSTAFGPQSPGSTQILEFDPPGEEDFMRYRMYRLWSKDPANQSVGYINEDGPIVLADSTPNGSDPYLIEDRNNPTGLFQLPRREKITIQSVESYYQKAGTGDEGPGITEPQDKWTLSIVDDKNDARDSTIEQPLSRNGIIGTFQKLINDSENSIEFFDHSFEYEVPLNTKDIGDNFYGSLRVLEADIKSVYNFYSPSYESILVNEDENLQPPESLLPSLYSFLTSIENEDNKITRNSAGLVDPSSIDTIFEKHITLNNNIDETRVATQVVYSSGRSMQTNEAEVSKGQYFDKYSYAWARYAQSVRPIQQQDTVSGGDLPGLGTNSTRNNGSNNLLATQFASDPNVPNPSDLTNLQNKFKNQIIPLSNIELFSDFNPAANRFPMYCEINFSTDGIRTDIVQAFEETDLMPSFIQNYVDGNFGTAQNVNFNFVVSGNLPFIPTPETFKNYSYTPINETSPSIVPSGSLKTYNILNWLSSISTTTQDGTPTNGVILGKYDEANQNVKLNSLTRRILTTIFEAKLNQATANNTRSWSEIVGGKFNSENKNADYAYNETLFYKVEKWSVNADGTPNENLQNFYFPNSRHIDKHHFTDTQVKYGKKYIYRIYAMEIVFGTRYSYQIDRVPTNRADQENSIDNNQARICVLTDPDIRLVEVPYYQKQTVMMDSPPVFPDIDVVTYRGDRTKIKFWLRGNTGEYKLEPVLIQDGDADIIRSVRTSQELDSDEPITFKSDDYPRYFEVYRIDKKPNRYSDFKDNRIASIDTNEGLNNYCQTATNGEFVDTNFDVNKKYYYMFRTIDVHGHFSNPSPVYELEMVYDGYAPFLLSNVYMLDENAPPPQEPTKKFTKYIYIKPAMMQKTVNEIESGLKDAEGNVLVNETDGLTNKFPNGNGIVLGQDDQSLWNKKLKIRIISKKTGKKIDLNVKYTKKHVELINNNENKIC